MKIITNNETKCTQAVLGLKEVLDPEIGLNIVDLGLIYELNFDEANKMIIGVMTLTTQFCPMGEAIMNAAENVLKVSFPLYEVFLDLSFDPAWSQEKMSPEGLEFLNTN